MEVVEEVVDAEPGPSDVLMTVGLVAVWPVVIVAITLPFRPP